MRKDFIDNAKFINLVRWWLMSLLLFLPFQNRISRYILQDNTLKNIVNFMDEGVIVIFILFAIKELYRKRETLDRVFFFILFPILAFSIAGFISGMLNKNSLLITTLGVFDYIKNFLVIFIYATFFRQYSDFRKIFRLLLGVAILLGVVAIIETVWAMVSVHVFGKNVADRSVYLLFHEEIFSPLVYQKIDENFKEWLFRWRAGLFRTSSLTNHPNSLGLYSVLILTVYLNTIKKINIAVFVPIFFGVFASVSRTAYIAFASIIGVQIFKGRRRFLPIFIAVLILLLLLLYLYHQPLITARNFNMSLFTKKEMPLLPYNTESKEKEPAKNYRAYTREKAMEILKEYPLLGIGPGMFGGTISIRFNSSVYEKYKFHPAAKKILTSCMCIDQFWPQVLAETGIIGTINFAGILIALFIVLLILKREAAYNEIKRFYEGLSIGVIVIIIYTFSNGLNITPVLFTWSALVGVGLGCKLGRKT